MVLFSCYVRGIMMLGTSQSSDAIYRLYGSIGRTRELHLDKVMTIKSISQEIVMSEMKSQKVQGV